MGEVRQAMAHGDTLGHAAPLQDVCLESRDVEIARIPQHVQFEIG